MAEVHAEVEYEGYDRRSIHSDICPPECHPDGLKDPQYRAFLHANLDEWLDRSGGTGMFWIGDGSRVKDH